jgi:GntR family transcriptional repressor for pyruvate dehydrogenase complex
MHELLDEIVGGEYAPGAQLPSEVGMSRERNVNKTRVRAAVEDLRKVGILDVRHGVGQFVRPLEDWDVLDAAVVAAILAVRRLDLVREIIDCQAMLEPPAAALAAERATNESAAELAARHDAVVNAAGRTRRRNLALEDPVVQAEIEFHKALARMTANRPLQRMLTPVTTAIALTRYELAPGDDQALIRALRRTLTAIEARDGAAARKSVEARVAAARRWLKRAA